MPRSLSFLIAGVVLATAPPAQPTGKKIALLVGLQEYAVPPDAEFGALHGPRNDMRTIQDLLVTRLGFAAEDIKVLLDAQATHAAIVQSFDEWLIRRADADTEVLFWFGGHGSRTRDRSDVAGAEQDYMDATFLAFDSRAEESNGAYDIVDDELHSLLAALTQRTHRVMIVTDACYSGGGVRGGSSLVGVRGVASGNQPLSHSRIADFWPADVPFLDDGDLRAPDIAQKYVHLSACTNQQRAFEIFVQEPDERRIYGAFSYYLVQAMREARPGDSIRRIAERARLLVATHVPNQSVCCEGALDREFLGASFVARPNGFEASASADGELRIDAGALHGLARDSELEIRDDGSRKVGTARVELLGSSAATARWLQAPAEPLPPGTVLRALETSRPAHLPPLRVEIEGTLRDSLASSPWLTAVTEGGDYRIVGDAGNAVLETTEGVRLWKDQPIDAALRDETRFRALWQLPQHAGSLPVRAAFVPPTAQELERAWDRPMVAAPVRPLGNAAGSFEAALQPYDQKLGELAILEVTNEHDHDLHLAVLSVTEARQISVLWPTAEERDRLLPVDEIVRVPVLVGAEPTWSLQRPMCDRYIVVVTKRYVDFNSFVTPQTRGDEPDASDLPGVLRLALTASRTRGGPTPIDEFAKQFGVTSVDLLVQRR